MICGVLLLLLLVLVKEKCAQTTAVIIPRGYNASLDPESYFTFQCDVKGADSVEWIVDNAFSTLQDVRDRGINESTVTSVNRTTRSYRASISVVRSVANKNTAIICLAKSLILGTINITRSDPVLFQVQGLLDSPPNLTLSDANNEHLMKLSWDKPFSLDITDIHPDISHYIVCYGMVNNEKFQCIRVNQTKFTFLYVNVPLLFTVSAVNVVGEGNVSSILHDVTTCNYNRGLIMNCIAYNYIIDNGNFV